MTQVTITTRAAQHHVADLNVPIGCAVAARGGRRRILNQELARLGDAGNRHR
jgi:hypothetical protein